MAKNKKKSKASFNKDAKVKYKKKKACKLVRRFMKDFGTETLENRAVPQTVDGLKPVYRKVIYTMYDMGAVVGKPSKKVSQITGICMGNYHPHGDCLHYDTKVFCLDGKHRKIGSIVSSGIKELDVLSYCEDSKTYVPTKAHSFRIGKITKEQVVLNFGNGGVVKCTPDHKFYIVGFGWKKAKNILEGDLIEGSRLFQSFNGVNPYYCLSGFGKLHQKIKEATTLDSIWHHKNHDSLDNRPKNLKELSRSAHASLHGTGKAQVSALSLGRERMFNKKSNVGKAISKKNSLLAKEISKDYALIRALKIVRILQTAGVAVSETSYETERKNHYNAPMLETLVERGYSLKDIVGQVKTFKLKTEHTKGLTKVFHKKALSNREGAYCNSSSPAEEAMKHKFLYIASKALRTTGKLTEKTYENTRVDLQLASTSGFTCTLPRLQTLYRRFKVRCFNDLLNILTDFRRVTAVKIKKLKEPETYYDFTVDSYENMLIFNKSDSNKEGSLIVAHNSSISDTIVACAHTRYPIVLPQGGFGSKVSNASAPRYIEARLSKFGVRLCDRMHIADMVPSYTGEHIEPFFIPTSIPLIFVNGIDTGIAVGLRVAMPSHNINSVVKALTYLLKGGKNEDKFLDLIDRPDFRDCVILSTKEELREIYKRGTGSIRLAPKHEFKKVGEHVELVITDVPPGVSASKQIEKLKTTLEKEGILKYISPTTEEVPDPIIGKRPVDVITVGAQSKQILESQVLPRFEGSYYINLRSVDFGKKDVEIPAYTFFTMAKKWVEYQRELKKVELKKVLSDKDYDLRINTARFNILGSKEKTDKLIKMIRDKKYKNVDEVIKAVSKTFKLDLEQSENLCNTQLRALANQNLNLIKEKIKKLTEEIAQLKKWLKDIDGCIVRDLETIAKEFGDENLTVWSDNYEAAGSNVKGKSIILGLSESGKCYIDKIPSNVPNNLIIQATEGAVVCDKAGLLKEFSLMDLNNRLGCSVQGVVPYGYDYALFIDDRSRAIVLDMSLNLQSKKTVMKDVGTIVMAVGINKGDKLYVSKKKFATLEITVDDKFLQKYMKRVGSVASPIYPGCKNGIEVSIVRKKGVAIDDNGKEIKDVTKHLEKGKEIYPVSKDMNLMRKGTKVWVAEMKEVLEDSKYLIK